ncbi:hypothetical protein E2562_022709 [Oryza meyeriana var. granulata]|uniref:Elongator complex protein 5 n=1 Tax=Oryza meyeriana var. granulata TaxID=110450 RepID=A0A6G1E2G1_9ORYZ|nr:hypothetical protein E2562_022709 [Oryza meyeriana var. granulata]
MAEAAVRCLRDGRLEGEHAPALAVASTLQGLVIVAFDRSPKVYLDFMRRRGLDQNALNRCVRILDCYSDPIGWKQKIRSQQQQESSADLCSMNKENVTVFRNVKDVDKLMCSTIDLGRGFEGEGKIYFSIAVDSISSMLRHASVSSISSYLSNLRSHGIYFLPFCFPYHLEVGTQCPSFVLVIYSYCRCFAPAIILWGYSATWNSVDCRGTRENYTGSGPRCEVIPYVQLRCYSSEVQFNLELSEKERTDKANVVLPFEHQGKGEPIRIYDGRRSLPEAQRDPNLTSSTLLDEVKLPKSATPKGEIHYIRDSDDEQPDSDEDPDDDLDI